MSRLIWGALLVLFAGPANDDFVRFGKFGDAAFARGESTPAAEWYERASGLAPESPEPLYNLALTYYRMGGRELTLRYLDKAQAMAHGPMLARCLLLRGDIEYRDALKQSPARQVEGLERALKLYRDAGPSEMARYDVEVVKLQLPRARSQAPRVSSPERQPDPSADETSAGSQPPGAKGAGLGKQDERDW